jgi:hypothetical protein
MLLAAEAASLRLVLGHWPVVYRDQPTGLLTGALDMATSFLVTLLFLGSPVWLASLWPVWLQGRERGVIRSVVPLLASAAILLAAVMVNPWGFPEWWLD